MARRKGMLDKQEILRAIAKAKGSMPDVCKMLKCSSRTVYAWIHSEPDIAEALDEAREQRYAEEELYDAENSRIADENARDMLLDKKGNYGNGCLAMTSAYQRRKWQRRDMEQTFASWRGGPVNLKLTIPGLDESASDH